MIDRQIIRRMTTLIPQLGRKRFGYRRGKPHDPSAFSNAIARTLRRSRQSASLRSTRFRASSPGRMRRSKRCVLDACWSLAALLTTRNARTNVAVRQTVVRASDVALRPSGAEADLAARSGEHLEHARRKACGLLVEPFRTRQRGPHPFGSPLGFAAVCAPGGPLQGQVASDQQPPISARPRRVRRRAPEAGPCLSAAGPRSPGGPRTLKRPSSRRRWATAPEGRSGRGRIEPDGET